MQNQPQQPIDWTALAVRLREESAKLIHNDNGPALYGDDFYAEALRRVFGYDTNTDPARRQLPYDSVNANTGLTTIAQAQHELQGHVVLDRLGRERAEAEVTELRAEIKRVYAEARKDIARDLREWCNERRIPAKLRREGFLMAANLINPQPAKENAA